MSRTNQIVPEGNRHETRPVPRGLGFESSIRTGDARPHKTGEGSSLQYGTDSACPRRSGDCLRGCEWEFFDSFEELVEDDASWAYKFQREYDRKTKDLDDVYFDIKDAEERRKKKGLPPRVAILPGWDMSDEDRYDEELAGRKKRTARKKAGAANGRKAGPARGKRRTQAAVAAASEGEARQ